MEPDLKLILDGETEGTTVEIWAWHQVLCNVSPYFRKLLAPGRFAEGIALHENKHAVVELHETNAQAMKIICDIVHHRAKKVPVETITSTQLFHIVVLADRFECGDTLQLWIPKWMEQGHIQLELKKTVSEPESVSVQQIAKWLVVCQNLSHSTELGNLMSNFFWYATEEDLNQHNNPFFDHLKGSLTDSVKGIRQVVIADIHAAMMNLASILEHGGSCQFPIPPDRLDIPGFRTEESFHCSSISLGNFVLASEKELGHDWKTLENWNASFHLTFLRLERVANMLDGPKLLSPRENMAHKITGSVRSHTGCSFRSRLIDIMRDALTSCMIWALEDTKDTRVRCEDAFIMLTRRFWKS